MMWALAERYVRARAWLGQLARRQKGQGLVEYALILVLVAIVVIAALTLLGRTAGNVMNQVQQTVEAGAGG
jgi:pilus assembly protein Flp/PilA